MTPIPPTDRTPDDFTPLLDAIDGKLARIQRAMGAETQAASRRLLARFEAGEADGEGETT